MSLKYFCLAIGSIWLNRALESLRTESSSSSRVSQRGILWWGFGLGVGIGVGGEAGADSGRLCCGREDGMPVLGVGGGLG